MHNFVKLMSSRGVNILGEEIKEKLTTENIFKIFNRFILHLLSTEERTFVLDLEKYCLEKVEPKIDMAREVYELFPILGKKGYMQRLNPIEGLEPAGMTYELILAMVLSIVDPELDLARVVSGVLATNPLYRYGKSEHVKGVLRELVSGKKVGSLCITERERGSDAVNMQTKIRRCEDDTDDVILDGEKVFTTNGPRADYFVTYGVRDLANPRGTMHQVLAEWDMEGLETNQLGVLSAPRVSFGQTLFKNVRIPKDNILGTDGEGYKNLFDGLIAERTAILGSSLGISWLSAITSVIYSGLRRQFGKPIFSFQAVSFPLTEMIVELMAATDLGFKAASEFTKIARYPDRADIFKYVGAYSAGSKYLAAKLAHRITYEAQQLCGGIAYTDNLRIDKALEVSKIQEVIGGSRNIQLLIVSNAIRNIFKLVE